MAFTKIAAAGIGSTGTITLQHVVVTGSVETPVITGAASTANVRANSLVVSGVSTLGSVVATTGTFSGNVSIAGTLTYEDVTNIDSVGIVTARSGIRVNSGGVVLVGSGTSTGTASQPLQVTGGAYVSGNLGIGTTCPIANLQVNNTLLISGNDSGDGSTPIEIISGAGSGLGRTTGAHIIRTAGGLGKTLNLEAVYTGLGTGGGRINFLTNNTVRVAISSLGTVLIGGSIASQNVIGSASSTTLLQVTGDAYVSGNLGVGTTNPRFNLEVGAVGASGTSLHVNGNARITGILSVGQGTITIDGNTDKITTPKLDYAGISSTISATAVDVFVYDTRKDSDGGAWRKRTQQTSWYNETLNTATRGSRRDFPAVAVLVLTSTTLTIYDGDDPDLPMWMVFNPGYETYLGNISGLTAVTMLNGVMVHGGQYDVHVTNFISDKTNRYGDNSGITVNHTQPISGRNNDTAGNYNGPTTPVIANRQVNDVAMTVLPNAPIDSTTGLPIPTIAVATAGGASVIKDDGTVANIGGTVTTKIDINQNLIFTASTANGGYYGFTVDGFSSINAFFNTVGNLRILSNVNTNTNNNLVVPNSSNLYSGQTVGLSLVYKNGLDNSDYNGMVAYATTSYATGWMHGNIKGAFLSDTSTTSVTGTELITNGTFDSNVTGWTANTSTNTWSSGAMQITRSGGSGSTTYQAFTTVAGQRYVATATVNSSGSRGDLYIINGTGWGGTQLGGTTGTFGQTLQLTVYFTATSTTTTLGFAVDTNGTSITVDNVSVRIAESDRSVNNKGLAVYGTITKTAVATGADLVAYSGWSSSNYLSQPYNSALDAGTGGYSFMAWVRPTNITASTQYLCHRGDVDADESLRIALNTNYWYFDYGTSSQYATFSYTSTPADIWSFVVFTVRAGQLGDMYVNGVLQSRIGGAVAPSSFTTNSSTYKFTIGNSHTYSNGPWLGSLALIRYSLSFPSPDQITKIYNDEKMLFQANSKATLYGTSSAVTALAYDDSTRLLYAGTSSGRSDFQGLERINNTTTAVTTAISASNGLVAEQ